MGTDTIGTGGNGVVVSMNDGSAMKMQSMDGDDDEDYLREIRILQKMAKADPRFVVRLRGGVSIIRDKYGCIGCFTMDRYACDLSIALKQEDVEQQEQEEWCMQLLDAAGTLHRLRIVHADIKAPNIMLDERRVIRLGDFGSSMLLDEPEETEMRAICTVMGRAPENYTDGSNLSPALDWWSIG